jgi:hypothetical protein
MLFYLGKIRKGFCFTLRVEAHYAAGLSFAFLDNYSNYFPLPTCYNYNPTKGVRSPKANMQSLTKMVRSATGDMC